MNENKDSAVEGVFEKLANNARELMKQKEEFDAQIDSAIDTIAKLQQLALPKTDFSAELDQIFTQLNAADEEITKSRQNALRLGKETRAILKD